MDKVANIKVMMTDNYSQFNKLLGNREITPNRVNTIKESILKIGYQPSPILVNEKKEVIDGQGRLAACEALSLPIYYIEKAGLTIDDCISMNRKMESWKIKNYIDCYAFSGNKCLTTVYCKPTTPPEGSYNMFYYNASYKKRTSHQHGN